jgi:hypothetical protein
MFCFDGTLADATSGTSKCTKCDPGLNLVVVGEGKDDICIPEHVPIRVHNVKVDMGSDTIDYDMQIDGMAAFMAKALATEFQNAIARANTPDSHLLATMPAPQASFQQLSNTLLTENFISSIRQSNLSP